MALTTKPEFVDELARTSGIAKADVLRVVDALSDLVNVELRSGREIKLPGIGKLDTYERAARMSRNPQTGAAVPVPAQQVVRLKVVAELQRAVNP